MKFEIGDIVRHKIHGDRMIIISNQERGTLACKYNQYQVRYRKEEDFSYDWATAIFYEFELEKYE